jgi:hypothetical protein
MEVELGLHNSDLGIAEDGAEQNGIALVQIFNLQIECGANDEPVRLSFQR